MGPTAMFVVVGRDHFPGTLSDEPSSVKAGGPMSGGSSSSGDDAPRWRRTITVSNRVGYASSFFTFVREIKGVPVPCPKCHRPDTAAIRCWRRRNWYTHCHSCLGEDDLTAREAAKLVEQVAPDAVAPLFEGVDLREPPVRVRFPQLAPDGSLPLSSRWRILPGGRIRFSLRKRPLPDPDDKGITLDTEALLHDPLRRSPDESEGEYAARIYVEARKRAGISEELSPDAMAQLTKFFSEHMADEDQQPPGQDESAQPPDQPE